MKKYIVIYHAPMEDIMRMQEIPPEQAEEGMKVWMDWAAKCGDHLVDIGSPLAGGQKLGMNGHSENSTQNVCGYSILQAENMDHARKLLEGHPHLSGWSNNCEIEVHEAMPLPE